MGEAALSSVDMGLAPVAKGQEEEEEEEWKKEESSILRWESLLPRMSLRVLLVEGDDSTLQIISALLRKCNYKVVAVPDSLKAWEILKEKPQDVDIILTEVQLPLISGFCLLTMIMGHETCKNIPVIMMSSHDSISIVFKCMMGGAADFLVKPLRKNELGNLWQHVWRRQNLIGIRHGSQDVNLVKGKQDTSSENNAASNHSSDYVACSQKNKEDSDKGSDTQSSCTKPGMEAQSACLNNMQDLLQPKCSSSLSINTAVNKFEEHSKLGGCMLLMLESEAEEDKSVRLESGGTCGNPVFNSSFIILEENHAHSGLMTGDEIMATTSCREDSDMVNETGAPLYKRIRVEPSKQAIDLIGTIGNQLCHSSWDTDATAIGDDISNKLKILCEKNNISEFNSAPLLELSLRSSEPSEKQEIAERPILNHSNASAFSWYMQRTVQPSFSSSMSVTEPLRCTSNTAKSSSNEHPGNVLDTFQCKAVEENNFEQHNPLVESSGHDTAVCPHPQVGIIPVPIPFSGMPLDGKCTGYNALMQPLFYTHPIAPPGPPPWRTDSTTSQETMHVNPYHQCNLKTHNHQKDHIPCDQNTGRFMYQSGTKQEKNLEPREDLKHVPPVPGQSGSSNLCDSSRNHLKSSACESVCDGSNRNVNVTTAASENVNDVGVLNSNAIQEKDYNRVSQREAALTKFRLKRKDRCYEKKVRYQSRKKLAELRPRMKGQFVRQVHPNFHQPSLGTDSHS